MYGMGSSLDTLVERSCQLLTTLTHMFYSPQEALVMDVFLHLMRGHDDKIHAKVNQDQIQRHCVLAKSVCSAALTKFKIDKMLLQSERKFVRRKNQDTGEWEEVDRTDLPVDQQEFQYHGQQRNKRTRRLTAEDYLWYVDMQMVVYAMRYRHLQMLKAIDVTHDAFKDEYECANPACRDVVTVCVDPRNKRFMKIKRRRTLEDMWEQISKGDMTCHDCLKGSNRKYNMVKTQESRMRAETAQDNKQQSLKSRLNQQWIAPIEVLLAQVDEGIKQEASNRHAATLSEKLRQMESVKYDSKKYSLGGLKTNKDGDDEEEGGEGDMRVTGDITSRPGQDSVVVKRKKKPIAFVPLPWDTLQDPEEIRRQIIRAEEQLAEYRLEEARLQRAQVSFLHEKQHEVFEAYQKQEELRLSQQMTDQSDLSASEPSSAPAAQASQAKKKAPARGKGRKRKQGEVAAADAAHAQANGDGGSEHGARVVQLGDRSVPLDQLEQHDLDAMSDAEFKAFGELVEQVFFDTGT
jgi:hypothetical protein